MTEGSHAERDESVQRALSSGRSAVSALLRWSIELESLIGDAETMRRRALVHEALIHLVAHLCTIRGEPADAAVACAGDGPPRLRARSDRL